MLYPWLKCQPCWCLLSQFCQDAVIQFSRLERNSATASKNPEVVIDSPCCGNGKLSTEQSTRPENLRITNTKPLPPERFRGSVPWGAYSGGEEANMYLQQSHTTAKTTWFAFFKCTHMNLFPTSVCEIFPACRTSG